MQENLISLYKIQFLFSLLDFGVKYYQEISFMTFIHSIYSIHTMHSPSIYLVLILILPHNVKESHQIERVKYNFLRNNITPQHLFHHLMKVSRTCDRMRLPDDKAIGSFQLLEFRIAARERL